MAVVIRGTQYDRVEVWLGSDGVTALYGVGTYPRGSVLQGETSYAWIGPYSEWSETFPELGDNGRGRPPIPIMPITAPQWFDPDNAGEHWGDDY